ncbi:hypothetical protein EJ02DRAFT_470108 [Clathrospora elynae]|uniref:Uncharacterized protein n=1 Tax=Clathrospora elynae TaxID=706981 RepID=A0A6A5SAD7_9PLEO|nr:hypothetical protein EJ02DRAFT_470108 [Clathrospora elynae]
MSHSTSVCSPPHLTHLTQLSNLSLRPRDPCHDLHDSHDPRTRPLAGSAAAAAGCAPPHSVVAPRPEHEKAWLFGRRSRPPSAPAGPQTSYQFLLGLAITPMALPNTLPAGLALPTPPPHLHSPSHHLSPISDAKALSLASPCRPSTAASHALAVLPRRPHRLQHAITVSHIQAAGKEARHQRSPAAGEAAVCRNAETDSA